MRYYYLSNTTDDELEVERVTNVSNEERMSQLFGATKQSACM